VPILIQSKLKVNQTLITAGGFLDEYRNQCWCVRRNGVPQPLPYLRSNAEETDLRIWLHSINSIGSRKLLYSPDTDVYNIGLPLVQQAALDVCLQLNGRHKQSHRYLYMNRFIQALNSDPDLARISPDQRVTIIQAIYIVTGCDYISYFKGIGIVYFLHVFYQHATFRTSGLHSKIIITFVLMKMNTSASLQKNRWLF